MSDQSIVTQGNYMSYRWGSRVAAFATEADRTLFEAAPELLVVLRYALADLQDVMPEFEPSGDRTHPGWQTIEDIKVALAKAKGQKETA